MKQPAHERITLVEVFQLLAPFEVFAATIGAAVRRLEREGVRTLIGVRFYGSPGDAEAGAVLTFADNSQIMEHIRMISGWPEFKALLDVVKPIDVRIYGRLGDEAQAWIRTMAGVSKVFENTVAGFVR